MSQVSFYSWSRTAPPIQTFSINDYLMVCKFNPVYYQKTEAKKKLNFFGVTPILASRKNIKTWRKKKVTSGSQLTPNFHVKILFYCKIWDIWKNQDLKILKKDRVIPFSFSKTNIFKNFWIFVRRTKIVISRPISEEMTGVCCQSQKLVNCLPCLWLELFCYFLRLKTFPVVSLLKL